MIIIQSVSWGPSCCQPVDFIVFKNTHDLMWWSCGGHDCILQEMCTSPQSTPALPCALTPRALHTHTRTHKYTEAFIYQDLIIGCHVKRPAKARGFSSSNPSAAVHLSGAFTDAACRLQIQTSFCQGGLCVRLANTSVYTCLKAKVFILSSGFVYWLLFKSNAKNWP